MIEFAEGIYWDFLDFIYSVWLYEDFFIDTVQKLCFIILVIIAVVWFIRTRTKDEPKDL